MTDRRLFLVVERQVVEQAAQHEQRFHIVLESHIGYTALGGVGQCTAQLFRCHFFVGHGLDHIGAGHEHVGGVLDHEDEVSQGRRIHRATGGRPHDQADLRHHARSHHIALEHLGITAKSSNAFLNTCTTRIVQTDHGSTDLHGLVHHLANFLCMRLGQRAPQNREILTEHEHQTAVDHAVASDHAVAGDLVAFHTEVSATVLNKHVPLFESAFVEQNFDALTRGELAFAVLGVDALLPTAQACRNTLFFQLFNDVMHGGSLFSPWKMCSPAP